MIEALYYSKLDNKTIQCHLCPRNCIVDEGRFGNCHARRNRNGVFFSDVYSKIAAINTDPIEKKPLYHFFPSKEILSVGSTGCNMHCVFCQNHTLSQCNNRKPVLFKSITAEELVDMALKIEGNIGIAFTYNEPTVNYEYVLEVARLAKRSDLKTVVVSNGYINPDPHEILMEYIDAFNIDLKAFSNQFYTKQSKASLPPVKDSLKRIVAAGKHLEITNLVIPTYNDDEEEFEAMCKWISNELGVDTVLHLSRYFPRYELKQYPTPPELLFEMYDMAKQYLNHVYLGNIATELHSNTFCPKCGNTMIERTYYHINKKGMDENGCCTKCGNKVIEYV